MPMSISAQDALLKWVSAGFPGSHPAPESLDDLTDGVILARILNDLDPSYDASDIDQSATPSSRRPIKKKNLVAVSKGLARYINRELPGLEPLTRARDLDAITEEPSKDAVCKLLSIMIAVAFEEPNVTKYVKLLQEPGRFDQSTMKEIQQIIIESQQKIAMGTRDPGLVLEEQLAQLRAEVGKRGKENADMVTRHALLQESHDKLTKQLGETQVKLDKLQEAAAVGEASSHVIDDLKEVIRKLEDEIDEKEAQAQESIQRLVEEHNKERAKDREKQEQLDDEVRELRHQKEELSKKANTSDWYKQTLKSLKSELSELEALRHENKHLADKVDQLEQKEKKAETLRKTLTELRTSQADSEQYAFIISQQRDALKGEVARLQDDIAKLKYLRTQDEGRIKDLVDAGAVLPATSPSAAKPVISLEDELGLATDRIQTQSSLALELGRVKAENSLLRKGMSSLDTEGLREKLDDKQREINHANQELKMFREKFHVAQDQLLALINNMSGDGNETIRMLRADRDKIQHELTLERDRIREVAEQLADAQRELLMAKTELSAAEKGSIDALEEYRATGKVVSASLEKELRQLRHDYANLKDDIAVANEQLVTVLLDKDKLRKEVDETKAVNEMLKKGSPTDSTVKKLTTMIEELKNRLTERTKRLEKVEQEKYDLHRKLKVAMEGGVPAEQKAATAQAIKSLQRENALIATAWYDLTSRLQSNHLVLQRRHDVPKSWLHKQRQLVNATPRR